MPRPHFSLGKNAHDHGPDGTAHPAHPVATGRPGPLTKSAAVKRLTGRPGAPAAAERLRLQGRLLRPATADPATGKLPKGGLRKAELKQADGGPPLKHR
jgi:hypothetical protein